MKRILLYSTIVLFLLPCLTFAQGQTILNVQGEPTPAEFKARDKVSAIATSVRGNTKLKGGTRLYCDPNIQVPVDYSSNAGAGFSTSTKTIDQSKAIGSIAGVHGVSAFGGATYTIPIEIPKGTGGVNYPIQLSYASGTGQGLAGLGWNINGLHLISRSGNNFNDDGNVNPITLTNADNFAFDGNRLIPDAAANNGKNNTIYHTYIDGFTVTTSHTSDEDKGPDWFEVKTKEGEIMEFGNTGDSKITAQKQFYSSGSFVEKTVVNLWYINKITDKNGNYILFDYENKNGNEVVLKSIRYAGNSIAGLNPDKSINFYYDISSFPNTVFVGGGMINSSVLLRKVEIKKASKVVRSYSMTYNKKNTFEFLVSIEEKNAAGESYNSTDFTYETPTTGGTLTYFPAYQLPSPDQLVNTDNKTTLFIDCNGDGFKDLVTVPKSDQSGDGKWYLYADIIDGVKYIASGAVNLPASDQNFVFPALAITNANTMVSDFDGDGKEDFMVSSVYIENDITRLRIKRFISTGSGFTENPSGGIDMILGGQIATNVTAKAFAGDINGDGKTDISVVHTLEDKVRIDVYLDLSGTVNYTLALTGAVAFNLDKLIMADIDADGTAEILNIVKISSAGTSPTIEYHNIVFANNSLVDISFAGSSYSPYVLAQPGCQQGAQPASTLTEFDYTGDFNGDGATDVLKYETATSAWSVDYTFGGRIKLNKTLSWMGDPRNCNHAYTFGDANGDGKTDIIFIEHDFNGTAKSYVHLYYSTGTGFYNENFSLDYDFSQYDFSFANMNKDAVGELVIYGPFNQGGAHFNVYNFAEQLGNFGSLKKVANGFNQEVIFNYTISRETNSGYTTTENLAYPYATIKAPFHIVKTVQTTNGVGGYNNTVYGYENATASRTGKGFLGFKKTTVSSAELKIRTENEYTLDAFPMLLPASTKVYNTSSGTQLLSTKIFHNGIDAVWSGARSTFIVKPLTTPFSSSVTDNLAGITNTTILVVDDYGNLVTKVSDNTVEKTTCDYTFDNSAMFTVPHLLTEEVTTIERDNQQNKHRSSYSYVNNMLSSRTDKPEPDDNAHAVTTAYEYYQTGNLKKKTTSAGGGAKTVWESYEYDANFVNIGKTTNVLSQSSFITNDAVFDVPKAIEDINGLVTKYGYDNWQRPVTVTYPNTLTATKKYEWVSSGDVPTGQEVDVSNVIYKITEAMPGKPTVVTYYDILNRAILTQTEGFSHTLFAGVEYNNKGQRIKSTNAYSTSARIQNPIVTTYAYNGLNQLISETKPINGTPVATTYTYVNGTGKYNSTVHFSDGNFKTTITDASGRVLSTTDKGGTVTHTYTLNSNNKSTRTTTVGNNTVIAEFDDAGHQTLLTDPAAGTTTYTYNPYGQLTHQKDAAQNEYSITYDELGRIDTKQGGEGDYKYTYETTNNGLNQLKKIEGPGNISYTYTYDNLQRLTKITEVQPGKSFETKYRYDIYGNQTEITYPNSFTILQDYNQNGYMTAIRNKQDGSTIWQGVETNEMGQFTSYAMGNHKATGRTYNDFGQPVEFNTSGLQQLVFDFNTTNGNIYKRTMISQAGAYEEQFAYDELNRLKAWQHSESADVFTMTYNSFGQFETKTDAGTYTFNSNNQPESIVSNGTTIPLAQQDVTFNQFKKPATVGFNENLLTYTYGADQQRVKGIWTDASAQTYRTRYYATNYEVTEEGLQTDRHTYQVAYINAPTGLCAMYVKKDNDAGELHYTYSDYLGSILLVTDKEGVVEVNQNFDAWGRYRDPSTLEYTNTPNIPVWLYRGYTGHEMLPEFGLINMNARLYDPQVGLMLSADNFVQAPGYTQSYNRYAYCFNNPLKYTDPTGNFTWMDAFAGVMIVGGGILIGTGAAPSIGQALIVAGVSHYGNAAQQSINYGTPWNQASSNAGITVSYTATVAVTTGPTTTPYINYEFTPEPYDGEVFEYNQMLAQQSNVEGFEATYALLDGGDGDKNTKGDGSYMAGAIVISGGLVADDATGVGILDDIAIPFIIGGAYLLDKSAGKGNSSYPGPWTYTYQHPSQNPINSPFNGFDPNNPPPNLGGAVKLIIGAKLVYEMYDEYNTQMNNLAPLPAVRDNTNVTPKISPYIPK